MAEGANGYRADRVEGMPSWASALDNSLLWVQPHDRRARRVRLGWWPALEQEMLDLHARYERACVEE